MTTNSNTPEQGQFAYDGLDRVMHEKARLGILSSLAVHQDGLSFNALKEACSLTDGNLSRHLTVLAEAKLVTLKKKGQGARQETRYRLTAGGRRRFSAYIDLLGRIAAQARPEQQSTRRRGKQSPGLSQA